MPLLLKATVLGIVEGITEFLPISSTGHLILLNRLIEFTGTFAEQFDIVIQLGAILAVVIYFFNRLWPFSSHQPPAVRRSILDLWYHVIVAVIPALVIGAAVGKKIQEHLFFPQPVAAALIIGGVILILVERKKRTAHIETVGAITYKIAIYIGLIQCLGMIPGTSRSAATIIGAILLGCSRTAAAEFSFFLAIPTLAAASAYSLLKLLKADLAMSHSEMAALGVGFLVSFLVAWVVIAGFMNYIRTRNFVPFGWYRIALGITVFVWLGMTN
jgi:undecaprenyl-diphosphatase